MIEIGFTEEQFYIVDDASTDRTTKTVSTTFPSINIFTNIEKKGYIVNRNFLMNITSKDYILSLDDDSHIREKKDIEEA